MIEIIQPVVLALFLVSAVGFVLLAWRFRNRQEVPLMKVHYALSKASRDVERLKAEETEILAAITAIGGKCAEYEFFCPAASHSLEKKQAWGQQLRVSCDSLRKDLDVSEESLAMLRDTRLKGVKRRKV